ncbi:MAG: hypothetical protein JXX28_13170 [Deltaproteobacteria bacterium]|nr:hypothetical protein [Deltaproteobacteria bacterium]
MTARYALLLLSLAACAPHGGRVQSAADHAVAVDLMTLESLVQADHYADAAAWMEANAQLPSAEGQFLFFELWLQLERWDEALAAFERARALNPDIPEDLGPHLVACSREREAVVVLGTLPAQVLTRWTPLTEAGRDAVLARGQGDQEALAAAAAGLSAVQRPAELDGAPVTSVGNADRLLAPVVEAFTQEGYRWIPLEHVAALQLQEPQGWIDSRWRAASVVLDDGRALLLTLPSVYAGSGASGDPELIDGEASILPAEGDLGRPLGQVQLVVGREAGEAPVGLQHMVTLQFDNLPQVIEVHGEPVGGEGSQRMIHGIDYR